MPHIKSWGTNKKICQKNKKFLQYLTKINLAMTKELYQVNKKKYNLVFASVFNEKEDISFDDFSSTTIDNWDSITQLMLVNKLEDIFDVMLDPQDIMEFKSYKIGIDILSRYEIIL